MNDKIKCCICGKDQFTQIVTDKGSSLFVLLAVNDTKVNLDNHIALQAISCNNCGHVSFFPQNSPLEYVNK